jgi:hypothetical protein
MLHVIKVENFKGRPLDVTTSVPLLAAYQFNPFWMISVNGRPSVFSNIPLTHRRNKLAGPLFEI